MNERLSAEIELAVCCCLWPASDEGDARVREVAQRVSSWARFDAIVRRNRINPLVNRALNRAGVDLPGPLRTELAKRAMDKAQRALAMARESARLQSAFEAEGVPTLVLKGSPLAILAYGDLGLKEARDIDLFVNARDCSKARSILARFGYGLNLADLGPGQFLRYAEHAKEAQFHNPVQGFTVDLHWRLVDNSRLMRGIDADGPAQSVALPGGTLRTLADEATFAFLCLHGANHSWGRLKWLADLHAFVRRRSGEEVEQLFQASFAYGADRSASVALQLCHRLFQMPLDGGLQRTLEQGFISRMLQRNAIESLTYRFGIEEHEVYTAPWLRMRAAQLFVARGPASVIEQASRIWSSSDDRARIALPPYLAFAYHLLRIPLWLGRTIGAWRRHARPIASEDAQQGRLPL